MATSTIDISPDDHTNNQGVEMSSPGGDDAHHPHVSDTHTLKVVSNGGGEMIQCTGEVQEEEVGRVGVEGEEKEGLK